MKANNLIASVAAVLFTTATLGALNYNVDSHQASNTEINGSKVINLAPVNVYPSAAERRAAALLADVSMAGIVTIPSISHLGGTNGTEQFTLIGSQLAMPYYSFGNKFGRISKE
jgi:acyl-[acyl carrier protein]--UDP-N-acetylglucosamine O-acyltransferase